jgi:hypothetical protein
MTGGRMFECHRGGGGQAAVGAIGIQEEEDERHEDEEIGGFLGGAIFCI